MRDGTGSQWRTSRSSGVTWSYFLLLQISLAATISTDWSPSKRHAGEQAVAAVHPESDKSGHSRFRSPKRQRLYVAPDKTELEKATADGVFCHRSSMLEQSPSRRFICKHLKIEIVLYL